MFCCADCSFCIDCFATISALRREPTSEPSSWSEDLSKYLSRPPALSMHLSAYVVTFSCTLRSNVLLYRVVFCTFGFQHRRDLLSPSSLTLLPLSLRLPPNKPLRERPRAALAAWPTPTGIYNSVPVFTHYQLGNHCVRKGFRRLEALPAIRSAEVLIRRSSSSSSSSSNSNGRRHSARADSCCRRFVAS